jgi:hypothetical protein
MAVLAGGRVVSMTASRAARTAARSATSRTKKVSFTTSSKCAPACARQRRKVLEHLPRLRRGICGPDQFTVLVLGDLAADHHEPTAAGDHLTVAAPSGYPRGSYNVLQHDHQRLSSTAQSGACTAISDRQVPAHRRREQSSSEFKRGSRPLAVIPVSSSNSRTLAHGPADEIAGPAEPPAG